MLVSTTAPFRTWFLAGSPLATLSKQLRESAQRPFHPDAIAFDDPLGLLETCENMGLEGIVSKRRASPYRSGPTRDWLKVKTAAWRAENTQRFELLKKSRN